jgi:hypothetical protein
MLNAASRPCQWSNWGQNPKLIYYKKRGKSQNKKQNKTTKQQKKQNNKTSALVSQLDFARVPTGSTTARSNKDHSPCASTLSGDTPLM